MSETSIHDLPQGGQVTVTKDLPWDNQPASDRVEVEIVDAPATVINLCLDMKPGEHLRVTSTSGGGTVTLRPTSSREALGRNGQMTLIINGHFISESS